MKTSKRLLPLLLRAARPTHLRSAGILAGVVAAGLLMASLPDASAQTNLIPPQIRNLVSVQRPGTFYVDVTYDLIDPDSQSLFISVEASSTGGTNYLVPMVSLSGDVGLVAPGLGKKIVWNAWNDWAGNYTTNAKVRLIADDTLSVNPPPTNAPPANMVWIPSGSFDMSGTMVYLSRGFYMAKYETTQTEFQALMTNNPSAYIGPTLPVNAVTWHQATNYCAILTAREEAAGRLPTGWKYRLPTEAEWEYACRAGTTTTYSFGNTTENITLYAWTVANSAGTLHDVGLKGPNRWGLHDMHGNAAEWCFDWHGSLPGGNTTDPQGPSTGTMRVVRGCTIGSWQGLPDSYCASSERLYAAPTSGLTPGINIGGATIRDAIIGFRVALARIQ